MEFANSFYPLVVFLPPITDRGFPATVFYEKNPFFGVYEVVELFRKKTYLKIINKRVRQKKIFSNLKEELEEAIRVLQLQELNRAKEILEAYLKIKSMDIR